ncbi:hypothetical protein BaRGS_00002449 [Batillaria attramentaria]|uniref:Uncharacterized protein n=1 Tax=Batillaria attramentaria TaxID=370345 RepID=A0ABD0M505_9CAEN
MTSFRNDVKIAAAFPQLDSVLSGKKKKKCRRKRRKSPFFTTYTCAGFWHAADQIALRRTATNLQQQFQSAPVQMGRCDVLTVTKQTTGIPELI